MHFHSFTAVVLGALAVVASAKEHSDNKAASNGTKHEVNQTVAACHQVNKLTFLADVASNSTESAKFLSKAKNETKAQAELSGAAAKLQTMSSNATLMATCGVLNAHEELKSTCKAMEKLQKLSSASSNATAKQELTDKSKNATKLDAQIAAAPAKLQTLTSNTTLVSACDALQKSKNGSSDSTDKGTSSSTSGADAIAVGKVAVGLLTAMALGATTLF